MGCSFGGGRAARPTPARGGHAVLCEYRLAVCREETSRSAGGEDGTAPDIPWGARTRWSEVRLTDHDHRTSPEAPTNIRTSRGEPSSGWTYGTGIESDRRVRLATWAAMTSDNPRPSVLAVDDEENIAYLCRPPSVSPGSRPPQRTPVRRRSRFAPRHPRPRRARRDAAGPRRLRGAALGAGQGGLCGCAPPYGAGPTPPTGCAASPPGGDDYIVKPFALERLAAGVHVALLTTRRQSPPPAGATRCTTSCSTRTSTACGAGGIEHHLTDKSQPTLLRCLLVNAGRVVTRAQILDHAWQYDFSRLERDHRVVRVDPAQEGRRHRPQADPHGARRRLHRAGAAMTLRRRLLVAATRWRGCGPAWSPGPRWCSCSAPSSSPASTPSSPPGPRTRGPSCWCLARAEANGAYDHPGRPVRHLGRADGA